MPDQVATLGQVTVFNCSNEPINGLLVQNSSAGSIPEWSLEPTPLKYTPAALAVPRTQDPSGSAAFALGSNPVVAQWDSFTKTTTVDIPPTTSVSLGDDLILYLTANLAVLLTTRGFVLATSPVTLEMIPG